ncbi:hypothetical protein WDU94_005575 [Cyamophila willieti]
MSRHPCKNVCSELGVEHYVNTVMNLSMPQALTKAQILDAINKNRVFQKLRDAIRFGSAGRWSDPDLKNFLVVKEELCLTEDDIVLRDSRIVIPPELQDRVVDLAHRGHQGIVRTKQFLRSCVWFPKMDELVEKKIKVCVPCQATHGKQTYEPIVSGPLPSAPWKELSLDFAGPFPNGKYVMVLIDDYSRYPVAHVLTSVGSLPVINRLKSIFALFGVPEVVKTDNGPPFNGQEFTRYLENLGCKHRRNDALRKSRQKDYADKTRNCQASSLQIGDEVLIKLERKNKYTPDYDPDPFRIVDIRGSLVVVERKGVRVTRNSSFFKKFHRPNISMTNDKPGDSSQQHRHEKVLNENQSPGISPSPPQPPSPVLRRSSRPTKKPAWFKDYVIYRLGGM